VGLDTPVQAVREVSQQIMGAARRTFKKLGVLGYTAQVENSFRDWDDSYHPHVHAIVHTTSGGRNFVPSHVWGREFYTELPNSLHPTTDGVKVEGVIEDLFACATYVTKSPYTGASVLDIPRIIDSIQACAGLPQFYSRGSLRVA
jgi:hypothetical protein